MLHCKARRLAQVDNIGMARLALLVRQGSFRFPRLPLALQRVRLEVISFIRPKHAAYAQSGRTKQRLVSALVWIAPKALMQTWPARRSARTVLLDMFRPKNPLLALHVVSGKSEMKQTKTLAWTAQPVKAQQKEQACASLAMTDTRLMAEATAMLVARVNTRLRITKPALPARAENL